MKSTSPSKTRTKPPEERRSDFMNSAERLFLQQGVGPTTIEQITSGADVAKGTFYLHFSSKEDILGALRERFTQEFLDRVKAAVAKEPESDWARKLRVWIEAGVEGYLNNVRLHDIVFHDVHLCSQRECLTSNAIIDHLADLLATGIRANIWSVDDPHFTAVFLFNALHGVVDKAIVSEKKVDRARLVHRLTNLCFRTVGVPS